jgi:hypothetical protein
VQPEKSIIRLEVRIVGFFPARQDFEIIGLLYVKNGLYCNIYELRSWKLIFSGDFG